MSQPKRSKNKRDWKAEEIFDDYVNRTDKKGKIIGKHPLLTMLQIQEGNWEELGFDGPNKITFTAAGIEYEEPNIRLSDRLAAAKESMRYRYPQKKAIEISANTDTGIKIVIDDYKKKSDERE